MDDENSTKNSLSGNFVDGVISIGKLPANQIVLLGRTISRKHALITPT